MSDGYTQLAFNDVATQGATSTVAATLNGVVAGSALIAFCWTGQTASPTSPQCTDAQGAYASQLASPPSDGPNTVWHQVYVLANANSGSHTATFQVSNNSSMAILLVEVAANSVTPSLGTPTGQLQSNPGTKNNVILPGAIDPAGTPSTLISAACMSSLASAGPNGGTGFVQRTSGVSGVMGGYRLETIAAQVKMTPTYTAVAGTGGQNFITSGLMIANKPSTSPVTWTSA